jgi:SAM-dependent methyltransferase
MSEIEKTQDVRTYVRQHYAEIAQASQKGEMVGCCSPSLSCCAPEGSSAAQLIPMETIQQLTDEDVVLSLGCGDPLFGADLKEGFTVLDLGSGAGLDCFRSARIVGSSGRVIGVDMTPEMLRLARANQAKTGLSNVEFRLGEIEHLPVADASVDVVISNCVINLSPDKPQVFREAYRVLKPGGRLAVSDIVTDGPLSETLRQNLSAWASCIAGALDVQDYRAAIEGAGFTSIDVERINLEPEDVDGAIQQLDQDIEAIADDGVNVYEKVFSARINAIKP